MTKLIVGLGNPGAQYNHTRHNVGWKIVDAYAQSHHVDRSLHTKAHAMCGDFVYDEKKIVLCKPLGYMNCSGLAVRYLAHWYQINPEDILTLSDDLDMYMGKVRFRYGGSAGGHNGLKDITQKLGTDLYWRCKYGIDRPPHGDIVSYVLGTMNLSESTTLADMMVDLISMIDQRINKPRVISL